MEIVVQSSTKKKSLRELKKKTKIAHGTMGGFEFLQPPYATWSLSVCKLFFFYLKKKSIFFFVLLDTHFIVSVHIYIYSVTSILNNLSPSFTRKTNNKSWTRLDDQNHNYYFQGNND